MRISKKHGVNPAIPLCFFCGEDKNELILAGAMKGDAEAPSGTVWDMNPCDECQNFMEQGVILISVMDGEMEEVEEERQRELARWESHNSFRHGKKTPFRYMPNPRRTGGWIVVRDSVIEDMIQPDELAEYILSTRWCFVPDEVWDAVGFPREVE
jgi:hypothetical protein